MNTVRTRFAPSPTGYLHIGSLRTALFAYLTARTGNGKVILRIEDTDQKRSVAGAAEKIIEILEWVGIKFDEGPVIKYGTKNAAHANKLEEIGDYGPYIQSQRQEIYNKYIKVLLEKDGAYYCFCTPEKLEAMRADQIARKLPPRYDRTCRNLSLAEVESRLRAGERAVIRQKMPISGEVIVHDELRGDIKFKAEDLEDHVLIKSDKMPTYHFALVIDDHLMAITHIIRGEEWLPSFPKNVLLYSSFGWQPPQFYHLPLTLNKGGGKLSKRQGDVAVEDYKAKGYLPAALINFSALLGWHPRDDNEILSLADLEKQFKVKDLGTSPAVFDLEKLDYLNGYYIRHKSLDELTRLCIPYLEYASLIAKSTSDEGRMTKDEYNYIKKVVSSEQERLKKLSEIGELTGFFFTDELAYPADLLVWKKIGQDETKANLQRLAGILEKIDEKDWNKNEIEKVVMDFIKNNDLKTGDYLWPMRAALTGRQASPGPFEVADVLGKVKSLKRITKAIEKL